MMLKQDTRQMMADELDRVSKWVTKEDSQSDQEARSFLLKRTFTLAGVYLVLVMVLGISIGSVFKIAILPIYGLFAVLVVYLGLLPLSNLQAKMEQEKQKRRAQKYNEEESASIKEKGELLVYEVEPGRILEIDYEGEAKHFYIETGPEQCIHVAGPEVDELHRQHAFPCTRFVAEVVPEHFGIWSLRPEGPYKEPHEKIIQKPLYPGWIGSWTNFEIEEASFEDTIEQQKKDPMA